MHYDYTGIRVTKSGPLGTFFYPFAGIEVAPDGTTKYIKVGNDTLGAKKPNGEKLFYHNDHLGGINVITDETGLRKQLTDQIH